MYVYIGIDRGDNRQGRAGVLLYSTILPGTLCNLSIANLLLLDLPSVYMLKALLLKHRLLRRK